MPSSVNWCACKTFWFSNLFTLSQAATELQAGRDEYNWGDIEVDPWDLDAPLLMLQLTWYLEWLYKPHYLKSVLLKYRISRRCISLRLERQSYFSAQLLLSRFRLRWAELGLRGGGSASAMQRSKALCLQENTERTKTRGMWSKDAQAFFTSVARAQCII